ncbi:MAG: SAV_915 family protein [Pseudonocardiaceae bacterium]
MLSLHSAGSVPVPDRLPGGSTAIGLQQQSPGFPHNHTVETPSSILFVPACPLRRDADTSAGFGLEVRRLASGEYGCLAFTSLALLVEVLGEFQPWVGLPEGVVEQELVRTGVTALFIDSGLPPEAWRWQQDSIEEQLA